MGSDSIDSTILNHLKSLKSMGSDSIDSTILNHFNSMTVLNQSSLTPLIFPHGNPVNNTFPGWRWGVTRNPQSGASALSPFSRLFYQFSIGLT